MDIGAIFSSVSLEELVYVLSLCLMQNDGTCHTVRVASVIFLSGSRWWLSSFQFASVSRRNQIAHFGFFLCITIRMVITSSVCKINNRYVMTMLRLD